MQEAYKKKSRVKINGIITLSKIDSSQGEHTITKSARINIVPVSFNFGFDKELLNNVSDNREGVS